MQQLKKKQEDLAQRIQAAASAKQLPWKMRQFQNVNCKVDQYMGTDYIQNK